MAIARILAGALLAGAVATGPSAQAQPAPAAADTPSPEAQDRKRLADSLGQSIKPLDLGGGKLAGTGGDWLAARLRDADIIMIGETHGTGSIARAAGMIVDALPRDRPLAYALEIGPVGALIQEKLLRGPEAAHEAYMADPRRAISFPFLSMREEAVLARNILARGAPGKTALWGLDQEFVSAAPLLLDRLDGWATSRAQKAAVAKARSAMAPLMAITSTPDSVYDALDAAFASGSTQARALIADMRFSTQVYKLQESAGSLSNRMREDYMKRNFLAHWRAAGATPPRVVMKFGLYHLTAGLSPTATPALGGFVNALALMDGKKTMSIMILCGPDGMQSDFRGEAHPCTEDFAETGSFFASNLLAGSATLIDTAPLRLIPGTLRRTGASEDIRSYIQSYDAIIILNGGKAGTLFAKPPASWFEGQ